MEEIKSSIRHYLLKEHLPGEHEENLTDSTPLLTGGILDSIATIKLVIFIEKQYDMQLKPEEMDASHLNTIAGIAKLVSSKISN
jgi:acyl carrier protein